MIANAPKIPIGKTAPRITMASIGHLMPLIDVLMIGVTGILAYLVCLQPNWNDINPQYVFAVVVGAILAGPIFGWFGVYRMAEIQALRPKLNHMIVGWMTTAAILLALGFSLNVLDSFSRVWAFAWLLSAIFFLLLMHYALWRRMQIWARDGYFVERAVIVGAGVNGQRLARY